MVDTKKTFISKEEEVLRDISLYMQGELKDDAGSQNSILSKNLSDLLIIPFNSLVLKRDVPLINIIINSVLYEITVDKYIKKVKNLSKDP